MKAFVFTSSFTSSFDIPCSTFDIHLLRNRRLSHGLEKLTIPNETSLCSHFPTSN